VAQAASTFRIRLTLARELRVGERRLSREDFFAWIWQEFGGHGLLGVHEGTLLSEDASREGLETETWTVDAGEAPRDRDWVGAQGSERPELYFADLQAAQAAANQLRMRAGIEVGEPEEQKTQDWDAEWKASFRGARVPPCWSVLPPWEEPELAPGSRDAKGDRILRLNPGAGFGTGTHETTQLCLGALAERKDHLTGARVLDFGSGSGILAIGAGLLGARVDAVEIDPLAIENAEDNARLNQVLDRLRFSRELAEAPAAGYVFVIANILRPVLLEFAERLVARLAPGGTLILSGLIEPDVEPVRARYSALLAARGMNASPSVRALNEWRAVVWG
jgi:ribosomal protein L11 methyltransferase